MLLDFAANLNFQSPSFTMLNVHCMVVPAVMAGDFLGEALLGDTGGLRGGPAAGGELACGQSALQLFVRELLWPAGLLDVDVAVGRRPLLVEHGELAVAGSR